MDLVPIPRSVADIQMEVRVAHMSIPRDVDVQMLNKIEGQPFKIGELLDAITELYQS